MKAARLDRTWLDRRRMSWLWSLSLPVINIMSFLLVVATGSGLWWLLAPLAVYVLLPIMDGVYGTSTWNPRPRAEATLQNDPYYTRIAYAFMPLQYISFFMCAWSFSELGSLTERALAIFAAGVVGGVAITNAHELGHQQARRKQWLSKLVLAQSMYGHFFVEHNRGHHVHVATPDDPASAKLGESYWLFLLRTSFGGLVSAWRIESRRLKKAGHFVLGIHNHILQAWSLSAVLALVLLLSLGPNALVFFVAQAIVGFCLLEVVNYIEHYGLLRQKRPDGRYERCSPEHSWNSNHISSNVGFFAVARHSDHHAHPTRPYQLLRHHPNSPQLPYGYGTMILMAYLPPVWKRVMDPRVREHYQGDLSRANLTRRLRKRL